MHNILISNEISFIESLCDTLLNIETWKRNLFDLGNSSEKWDFAILCTKIFRITIKWKYFKHFAGTFHFSIISLISIERVRSLIMPECKKGRIKRRRIGIWKWQKVCEKVSCLNSSIWIWFSILENFSSMPATSWFFDILFDWRKIKFLFSEREGMLWTLNSRLLQPLYIDAISKI